MHCFLFNFVISAFPRQPRFKRYKALSPSKPNNLPKNARNAPKTAKNSRKRHVDTFSLQHSRAFNVSLIASCIVSAILRHYFCFRLLVVRKRREKPTAWLKTAKDGYKASVLHSALPQTGRQTQPTPPYLLNVHGCKGTPKKRNCKTFW